MARVIKQSLLLDTDRDYGDLTKFIQLTHSYSEGSPLRGYPSERVYGSSAPMQLVIAKKWSDCMNSSDSVVSVGSSISAGNNSS